MHLKTAVNISESHMVTAQNGERVNLLDALVKENFLIYSPCGGKGLCGKCKVQVKGEVSDLTREEEEVLTPEEIEKGIRLACRTYVIGSARVCLAQESRKNNSKEKIRALRTYTANSRIEKIRIEVHLPDLENDRPVTECIQEKLGPVDMGLSMIRELSNTSFASTDVTAVLSGNELIDIEFDDTTDKKFGAAIDIGTTTIACYLMDLTTGSQVHVGSAQNPQSVFGADVISRINYCVQHENGITLLSRKVKACISGLLETACRAAGVNVRHVYECVLVGNTTMNHLFWEINPESLSRVPFVPVTRELITTDARNAGICGMNARGRVVFLPCIGGFVGSDTLGAVIAADLEHKVGNTLMIDLGTNGEIVLSHSGMMYACSAAAGPAFEGACIDHGMQAFGGAINKVVIDDDLTYTTIDNEPAKGICGSGLIDIVSQFLMHGIINEKGRIAEAHAVENQALACRIVKENRRKRFILARKDERGNGQEIYISQKDIRELQLAKGAIRAGINILLKTAGIHFKDIDRIFLAGAFGNFINKESARNIGVFPDIPLDRVISLGNAAGEGATCALCDRSILQGDIVPGIRHVAVSSHPDFEDEFVNGMSLKP